MAEKKKAKQKKIYKEKAVLNLINKGKVGKYYIARNIYLKVKAPEVASWFTRFQFEKTRYEKKLGTYGENNPYLMNYEDAISESVKIQRALADNKHPIEQNHINVSTLNELHEAYLETITYSYDKQKHLYNRFFRDELGKKPVSEITRADVEKTINTIYKTGYNSLAIKALFYTRSLFHYAHLHRFTIENVADHLDVDKHAGGFPSQRDIHLDNREVKNLFTVFQQFPQQAPIEKQIAIALYLIFGSRKSEILSSQWSDFDFNRQEWTVHSSKMGNESLVIDVPDKVIPLFHVLKVKAKEGSPYIFPTKTRSRSGHMSESTLNAMLKVFYGEYETNNVKFNNPLGKANVRKFTIHDLRRTFATNASDNEVAEEVTERCLNHKKRKGVNIYDLSTRRRQRKQVYKLMADIILPLANLDSQLAEYAQEVEFIKDIVLKNNEAA